MCKITVLMAVKNGENFLEECMDSILNQTFTDFEFLIFDDNSVDATLEMLNKYQDPRIRIFTGTDGYIANLNRGIELAKGKYIARMDHDDIADHRKLAIQWDTMESLDVDVCATWVYLFGGWVGPSTLQETEEREFINDPLRSLKDWNYIHHSTTMLRTKFLIDHNLRYEYYFPADDYKLWTEIAKKQGKFYMIPQPLLSYRVSGSQAGAVFEKESIRQIAVIQQEIKEYLGLDI